MEEKKKAQVSIEILVILGLLVVGAIVFSAYYITNLQHKVGTSATTQGAYADISENINTEDPQQLPETCGNGYCSPDAEENCSSCEIDCKACPLEPILELSVNDEPTPQGALGHNTFDITAEINNYYEDKAITLTKIEVFDQESRPTSVCYYDNEPIGTDGLVINELMSENSGDYSFTISDISCTLFGEDYSFKVTARISGETDTIDDSVSKDIDRLTATLALVPDGKTELNTPFGLYVNVNNYNSDSDINITKIYVKDTNTDTFVNTCSFNNTQISTSGLTIDRLLTKSDNDYNLLFKDLFKCSKDGDYTIILTVHDNDENTDYDWNATIPKTIAFNRCYFSKGDTIGDPQQISSASQLDCIRYNLSKHYVLNNNIDLNHTILSSESWYDSARGWLPIGTTSAEFTGSLNGNNYAIKNLYINRKDESNPDEYYGGLFKYANNASFSHLKLQDVNISARPTGGLVYSINQSTIDDVNITGIISGGNSSGGLIGMVYDSNISNSSVTGSFTGKASFTGGLIGETRYINMPSNISNCYFYGNYLTNSSISGGLIGQVGFATITNCYTDGNVLCNNCGSVLGGLIGYGGVISNSYSSGDILISGDISSVGGISGVSGLIVNSYSTKNIQITGNALNVGGLNGYQFRDITNSYSTGNINITGTKTKIGGLIGSTLGTTTSSYWDINTSGQTTSAGGVGKTTAEMKTQSTFIDWNFENIWDITENVSYPFFKVLAIEDIEPPILGEGDKSAELDAYKETKDIEIKKDIDVKLEKSG